MNNPAKQIGITLLELAIALTILTVLISMAAPGFGEWISNSKILTLAEGFQNGLQLARAEAVRTNNLVFFQITNTLTDSCNATINGTNWVVRRDEADGDCATSSTIIQSRASAEGSTNITVSADCAMLGFDGMGQLIDREECGLPEDGQFDFAISAPTGSCITAGGTLRCRRVVVSLGGQVRICDPAVTTVHDPRRC